MYKILIVDDERNEREGIKKLLLRYQFDFDIYQACNGEEAFHFLVQEEVDVLLTDIKMPHMSGIELIEKVQQHGLNPITIIYSAYGEFEYAQNAISLGVMQYLLKPVRLEDFETLFHKVTKLCQQREHQKQEEMRKISQQENTEREHWNQHLIAFLEGREEWRNGELLQETVPLFISSFSNRFSHYWDSYIKTVQHIFSEEAGIISKSDTELFILIPEKCMCSEKKCSELCEKTIASLKDRFQTDVFIVVGKTCHCMEELKKEYAKLSEQLDYQFFVTESTYFLNGEGNFIKKKNDMLNLYFEKIETSARLQDFQGMKTEFDKAFEYVKKTIGFSSVYIKYNFSEIIKKCCEILNYHDAMVDVVEKIYGAYSIQEVKEAVFELIDKVSSDEREKTLDNRLVALTKDIVREQYDDYSLSVASIAEKLHISAAYLSTLFKLDMNVNLVKYISQYRIEKAKELLNTSNIKVGDIAKSVGYLNTSYFIALFKTSEGCSPTKYRERSYQNEK